MKLAARKLSEYDGRPNEQSVLALVIRAGENRMHRLCKADVAGALVAVLSLAVYFVSLSGHLSGVWNLCSICCANEN